MQGSLGAHTPAVGRPKLTLWATTTSGHVIGLDCHENVATLECWASTRSARLLVGDHTFGPGHLWGYVANLTRLCGPNSWPRQVLWAVTYRRGQGLCWECGCARCVATRTLCACTKRNVDARAHRMVARTFRVGVRGRDIVRRCMGPRVREQSLTLSFREGYESDGSEKRGVLLP